MSWRTILVLAALASAGCSTQAHGVAPAKQGWVYVVGAKNARPQAWLCPVQPGDCKMITIVEDEK